MAAEQQGAEVVIRKQSGRMEMLKSLPWIPIVILLALIFAAVFAPVLTPHDPYMPILEKRLQPPAWQEGGSPEYPLGTDTLGRDLLTRIFFGTRISLIVAFLVLLFGGGIGLTLGITAGYTGGLASTVIMRLVDSLLAIPSILLALVFAMTLGPSMNTVILALSLLLWTRFARVIRGEALALKKRDFILQARVAGCSNMRIMITHVLPNVFNTFMVLVSLNVGWVIIIESSLSFLGAGIPPPTPSWGQMVSDGRGYITTAWWITFFPGLALALAVLAFNTFGDWLRDKLDPKLRQL